MNKRLLITLFFGITLFVSVGASLALAQGIESKVEYTPLEPISAFGNPTDMNFAGLLNGLFRLLFTAGALFAVVMLVWGGITYMVSGAVGEVGEAKKRMQAAIFGLLLLAGAYLILYTINPQLLRFEISNLDSGNTDQTSSGTSGGSTTTGSGGTGTNSSAPCTIGNLAFISFPSNSPCGQALSNASSLGGTLRETPDGKSIFIAKVSNSSTNYSSALQAFQNGCRSNGGYIKSIPPGSNDKAAYLCLAR